MVELRKALVPGGEHSGPAAAADPDRGTEHLFPGETVLPVRGGDGAQLPTLLNPLSLSELRTPETPNLTGEQPSRPGAPRPATKLSLAEVIQPDLHPLESRWVSRDRERPAALNPAAKLKRFSLNRERSLNPDSAPGSESPQLAITDHNETVELARAERGPAESSSSVARSDTGQPAGADDWMNDPAAEMTETEPRHVELAPVEWSTERLEETQQKVADFIKLVPGLWLEG